MIKRLTSLQNETVKKAASLQQKYRLREGLFLVEGVRAVPEVRSSSWTVTAYFLRIFLRISKKRLKGQTFPIMK